VLQSSIMADIENKYYQVNEDGVDSQPVTSGRWLKLGAVLFSGVSLAILYVSAQTFGSTDLMTNSAESTNLVGLSTHLRPSSAAGCALPGCGPFQKIAMAGIQALNEGKRVRDVAVMANMDKQTRTVMARAESAAKDMSGVTAPFGFWDPMGLSTNIPEGKLLFFREAELKHGRVSMLACLGILVGEKYHPFFGVGAIPSTDVFSQTSLNLFWINLAIFCFFLEGKTLGAWKEGRQLEAGYVPGDLEWDPLGIKPKDAKGFKEMQTRELNNGRLAMFASLGMIAQELLTDKTIDQSPWYPNLR